MDGCGEGMRSQIVYLRQTFLNEIVNGFGRGVFLMKTDIQSSPW